VLDRDGEKVNLQDRKKRRKERVNHRDTEGTEKIVFSRTYPQITQMTQIRKSGRNNISLILCISLSV
jgi:hypothetical protein